MEQFKIPVDVQVEDKIVGPLTLRHLIIIGTGGGIAYFIYVTLQPKYFWEIWVPPVVIISLLTLAFAFLKIHHMTFFQFIIAWIQYNLLPKKRIWKQNSGTTYISIINPPQLKKTPKTKVKSPTNNISKQERIQKLTNILDQQKNNQSP